MQRINKALARPIARGRALPPSPYQSARGLRSNLHDHSWLSRPELGSRADAERFQLIMESKNHFEAKAKKESLLIQFGLWSATAVAGFSVLANLEKSSKAEKNIHPEDATALNTSGAAASTSKTESGEGETMKMILSKPSSP